MKTGAQTPALSCRRGIIGAKVRSGRFPVPPLFPSEQAWLCTARKHGSPTGISFFPHGFESGPEPTAAGSDIIRHEQTLIAHTKTPALVLAPVCPLPSGLSRSYPQSRPPHPSHPEPPLISCSSTPPCGGIVVNSIVRTPASVRSHASVVPSRNKKKNFTYPSSLALGPLVCIIGAAGALYVGFSSSSSWRSWLS